MNPPFRLSTPFFSSKRRLAFFAVMLLLILSSVLVSTAMATDEAITNGGFESGLTRWDIYEDGFGAYDDFHISIDDVYSGNYGVHVPDSAEGLGCLIIQNLTVPIDVENLINFTAWVKGGVGDGTFWAGLVFTTSGWDTNLIVLDAAGSAGWTQLYCDDFSSFTGEKITAITVTAYGGDEAGEDTYFDAVSLEVTEGAGSDWGEYTYTEGYGATFTKFMEFVIPVGIIILPAALLCLITRRVDKWLIIIGVVMGTALGAYFTLVPLWVVFLVTIGLIGMVYSEVRRS